MMKKTTSALAAAALLGTGIGTASAATFQIDDSTSVDLGARFYSWVTGVKDENGKSKTDYATSPRLNFGGSTDAVDGLTASMFMQFRPDATLSNNAAVDEDGAGVRTHVAWGRVSGEFGSITYGKNDNLFYRYLDVIADKNDVLTYTFSNASERTRVLTYASPDFDGFGFEVEAELQGDSEKGQPVKDVDGNEFTTSNKTSSINAAAYADIQDVRVHVAYAEGNLANPNSDSAYGIGAVTSIQDVKIDAYYKYSNIFKDGFPVGGEDTETAKQKIYGVIGEIDYDGGIFQLGAQQVKGNNVSSRTEVIARAVYNLADNVYVSAEYRKADKSQDEGDGYAAAFSYKF
ncbi:porin [Spiribacter onubensis]|uniref:Porin n=1 Tax=Spiribacter onubensis TaxID=3122420 RepID=A0ABV3S9E6_9GAMM